MPVLLTGDLNAGPDSDAYRAFTRSPLHFLDATTASETADRGARTRSWTSAWTRMHGREPAYTFAVLDHGTRAVRTQTLDYIFVRNSVHESGTRRSGDRHLQLWPEPIDRYVSRRIGCCPKGALPTISWPSDHLSLVC